MKFEDAEVISKRLAELKIRADADGWSDMRRDLEARAAMWKGHIPTDFLLKYGKDYATGPDSFALPRMTIKQCYMNAMNLAMDMPHLTYVEGKIACHGIPIEHAWCVDENGLVVDPTIRDFNDGHITDYFGVPFRTDYLRKAGSWNRIYGSVLDYFHANRTAPKLYELGLVEGQQWLLDQGEKPPRKPRKKKAAQ